MSKPVPEQRPEPHRPPSGRGFSVRETLLPALLAIGCALLAALSTLAYLIDQQRNQFVDDSRQIERQVTDYLQVSARSLHALAAIHQAAEADNAARQFGIFAQGELDSHAFILTIGRYDRINLEQVQHFDERLKQHGVFKAEQRHLRQYASQQIGIGETRFSPVVNIQPQTTENLSLIGLDIGSYDSLSGPIQSSTTENRLRMAKVPDGWPLLGQSLLLFHPTYTGHYAPQHPIDRLDQTDGGYWLAADAATILSESLGEANNIDAGLAIETSAGSVEQPLAFERRQGEALHLEALFTPLRHHAKINVGGNTLQVDLYRRAGLSSSQFPIILAALCGALLLSSLVLFLRHMRLHNAREAERQQRKLQQERERALVTLESIEDGVITTNSEGVVTYLNPAADRILDGAGKAILGQPLEEQLQFSVESGSCDSSFDIAHADKLDNAHILLRGETLQDKIVDLTRSPLSDSDNRHAGTVLALRDVSEARKLSAELHFMAAHDRLTKLPNRAEFERRIGELIADLSSNPGHKHAICYVDLDQFKLINDTCGHASGDLLLKRLARDLAGLVKEGDTLARLGGDEFGVLLPHCDSVESEKIANAILAFFQQYFFTADGKVFSVRASLGLVNLDERHSSVNQLMSELDIACYQAKDAGRNQLRVFDADAAATQQAYGEMMSMTVLQNALRDNRFTLYVQPIAAVRDSHQQSDDTGYSHYEILLRMIDDDGSVLSPFRFILAAERYDMIKDIDRWVIAEALSKIATLNQRNQVGNFSINLSGQSLADVSLLDYINEQLQQHQVEPSQLCFEITETAVIGNFDTALKLIEQLRERGCRIALDDFGAGVSSFGYLRKLPIDYLKIDGQFIRVMVENPVEYEMVRSMTTVGKALGVQVVAEFVENESILAALAELNIDFAQGYHISAPGPIDDLLDRGTTSVAA